MLQVLVDQQLLTTDRTRNVMLRMLPEGEDASAWACKLNNIVKGAAAGDEINVTLWHELSAQVPCLHWIVKCVATETKECTGKARHTPQMQEICEVCRLLSVY
jgi:hypothetical protein